MTFTTERVCTSLEQLDRIEAIRAIHQALLQLEAGEKIGFDCLDNAPAIAALRACMATAGHPGYQPTERITLTPGWSKAWGGQTV